MGHAPSRVQYSVGIGFPCGPTVPYQTAMSLAKTAHFLAMHGVPVDLHTVQGSSAVTIARDMVLEEYLKSKANYLFWIDSDIVWNPEDFIRILRLSKELGIACAAYPLKREPLTTVINFADESPEPNALGCIEITGTGLGFTCIRRDIIEAFVATKSKMYHPGNDCMLWDAFRFDVVDAGGRRHTRGEDGAFFADLRALGNRIWLDPSISLGHVGTKEYRLELESVENPVPPKIQPFMSQADTV